MEGGFRDFLTVNGNPNTNVTWAKSSRKQDVVNEIESMLNKDIPVVFAYHTYNKNEKINLYNSINGARNNNGMNEDGAKLEQQSSHYMTVIGLYKYAGDEPLQCRYILEVVSWGKVYYINYDMYANKLGYCSNILSVY